MKSVLAVSLLTDSIMPNIASIKCAFNVEETIDETLYGTIYTIDGIKMDEKEIYKNDELNIYQCLFSNLSPATTYFVSVSLENGERRTDLGQVSTIAIPTYDITYDLVAFEDYVHGTFTIDNPNQYLIKADLYADELLIASKETSIEMIVFDTIPTVASCRLELFQEGYPVGALDFDVDFSLIYVRMHENGAYPTSAPTSFPFVLEDGYSEQINVPFRAFDIYSVISL